MHRNLQRVEHGSSYVCRFPINCILLRIISGWKSCNHSPVYLTLKYTEIGRGLVREFIDRSYPTTVVLGL